MDTLVRELTHLGLSEKEAAVYLAAMQLGPVVVQEIADASGVNRATTYLTIELLEHRGLLASTEKNGKRLFVAEPPERLLTLVHLQRRELEEREAEMTALLPRLTALFNGQAEKPDVRYWRGVEGVEAMRQTLKQLTGEVVQIVGYDAFARASQFEKTEEYRQTLRQQGTPVRALLVTALALESLEEQFSRTLAQVIDFRVVPPSRFPFVVEGEITTQADRLIFCTYAKEPLAVEVRSQILADTFRGIFELAWSQ